jgi:hypothetical protein
MHHYDENYLPRCGGSVDVVHMKWIKCPAGDVNHATGKERYPSLAFEVVTGFDHQILGVSSAHFCTRNDKQIVLSDETIQLIKNGWYKNIQWKWYDEYGNEGNNIGLYFICDRGNLHWPELICPFKHKSVGLRKGYFSSKLRVFKKIWNMCLT